MINKEIEKLKKKLKFDKGCHVLGYITGDKDEIISIEEIENILQYIEQLENKVKELETDKQNLIKRLKKDVVNITKILQDGRHCDDYSRCRLKAYRTKTKEIIKLLEK